jgi:cytidine deaminase
MIKDQELIRAARAARRRARADQSGFKVGAALETRTGKIFQGCNVENSSYGLTVCAERVAVWNALSQGEMRFRRIVIVAPSEELTPPCGACRQIIWECCGDIEVLLANLAGKKAVYRMSQLFPLPFDQRFLDSQTNAHPRGGAVRAAKRRRSRSSAP